MGEGPDRRPYMVPWVGAIWITHPMAWTLTLFPPCPPSLLLRHHPLDTRPELIPLPPPPPPLR